MSENKATFLYLGSNLYVNPSAIVLVCLKKENSGTGTLLFEDDTIHEFSDFFEIRKQLPKSFFQDFFKGRDTSGGILWVNPVKTLCYFKVSKNMTHYRILLTGGKVVTFELINPDVHVVRLEK